MKNPYWKMAFIHPSDPNDTRCVMLYGDLDEVVGPLSSEQADAWIATFDNRKRDSQGDCLGARLEGNSILSPRST